MSMLLRLAGLNAAYAATIDQDRLEAWPAFFVEDCLYKITSAENHRRGYAAGIVYADSQAMLRDRVTALRTANIFERHSYRHIVGLPVIDPSGVTAETPFLVARIMRDGRTDVFATGVYLDRLHDEGADLRFAERIVVCDSSFFDTLLAIPL
jgi:3-phenylpropionate/cinnamic acid dioxygenase small subunit